MSLHVGAGLQFHRADGRPNIRLELLYNKGFLEQIRSRVDYWYLGLASHKNGYVYGRGSWIGLRLSYTIPIISWEKKTK